MNTFLGGGYKVDRDIPTISTPFITVFVVVAIVAIAIGALISFPLSMPSPEKAKIRADYRREVTETNKQYTAEHPSQPATTDK